MIVNLPVEQRTIIRAAPPGLVALHATIATIARVARVNATLPRMPFPPALAALDERVQGVAVIEIKAAEIDAALR